MIASKKQQLKKQQEIKTVQASYICPSCRSRQTISLCYIPRQDTSRGKLVNLKAGKWCSNCKVSTEVSYSLRKTKKGSLVFRLNDMILIPSVGEPVKARPRFRLEGEKNDQ